MDSATYRHAQAGPRAVLPRRASLLVGEETVGAALREGVPLVVGRGLPADVVLADRSLSRVHARLIRSGDEVLVEDLDSTNGVSVDGQRTKSAAIGPDRTVMLGNVRLMISISSFAAIETPRDELVEHVAREVVRARTFRRTCAVLAVRSPSAIPGWSQPLDACLRAVDAMSAASEQVCLLSLAEAAREDIGAWVGKVRAALPDHELRTGAALYPEHGDEPDELIRASLAALGSARAGEVGYPSDPAHAAPPREEVIIRSRPMRALYDLVARVARLECPSSSWARPEWARSSWRERYTPRARAPLARSAR